MNDQTATKDSLGFKGYAKTLAQFINHPNTQSPLTVGILGRWGTGKSTLMEMIEEEFAADNLTTVWFNAWRYSQEDEMWAAFLQSILNKVQGKQGFRERLKFKGRLFKNRVRWQNLAPAVFRYVL